MTALLLAGLAYRLVRRQKTALFRHTTMRRLTNSGDVLEAAISPSGHYVAYLTRNGQGQESLNLLDLQSGASRALYATERSMLRDPRFAPNEAFLYFRTTPRAQDQQVWNEMRLPFLGGEPVFVVRDVDGPVTFIDNGRRLCFGRGDTRGNMRIISASALIDLEETVLAQTGRPEVYQAACAPNGQAAALATESNGLNILSLHDGARTSLQKTFSKDEIVEQADWASDGSALVTASLTPFNMSSSLSFITFPEEQRTQITQDLDDYDHPVLSGDGKSLVARRTEPNLEVHSYLFPLSMFAAETSPHRWSSYLGWKDDDTLVGSGPNGTLKTYGVEADRETAISTPPGMQFLQPNRCGNDAWVAVGSRTGDPVLSVWYMRQDGSVLRRLSTGTEDILPVCTPDGRWAFYADNSGRNVPSVYRILTAGGVPQRIGGQSVWFALSPDGRKVAWFAPKENGTALFTQDLASGTIASGRALPAGVIPSRALTWSDATHILFTVRDAKAAEVWKIATDGEAPTKLIEFRDRMISTLQMSPRGKRLGIVTAHPVADVVLIQSAE